MAGMIDSKTLRREAYLLMNTFSRDLYDLLDSLVSGDWFVVGGAVTSVLSNRPINDYDICLRYPDQVDKVVEKIESEKDNLKPTDVFDTDVAYSLKIKGKRYQIVKLLQGNPDRIISNFDFTICQCFYDPSAGSEISFSRDCIQHLSQRRLVYTGTTLYPIASLYRTKKYLARGFKIDGIDLVKIALDIQKLKINKWSDLKAQLMGIDTLLLKPLLDELDSKSEREYNHEESLAFIQVWTDQYYRFFEEENEDGGSD